MVPACHVSDRPSALDRFTRVTWGIFVTRDMNTCYRYRMHGICVQKPLSAVSVMQVSWQAGRAPFDVQRLYFVGLVINLGSLDSYTVALS